MKTTALIIAAAAIVLGSAAPALAAGQDMETKTDFRLVFSRAELQTASGRADALIKVEAAATRLCAHVGLSADRKACVVDIVSDTFRGQGGRLLKLAKTESSSATMLARN